VLQKLTNFCSIDLIGIKDDLNNLSDIYNFLDNLCLLDKTFKEIHKPIIVPYYYGKVPNDCGVSCFLGFEGGYMAFHIFEKRNIAYFDIVSEKKFNEKPIIEKVSKFCGTSNIKVCIDREPAVEIDSPIFGPHIQISGKSNKIMTLNDMLNLQNNIMKKIDMTPIIFPIIMQQKDSIILFILIAESHIAIKVKKEILSIDIFSCKMFDIDKLKKLLTENINIERERMYFRYAKLD